MRTTAAVLLAVLGCALGLPQNAPSAGGAASNRQGFFGGGFQQGFFGGGSEQGFGLGFQRANEEDWGPKAYGPGLKNPWAFPLNPFIMRRAVGLADTCPGTLVKVKVTGEVVITDEAGWEVEIVDWMGNDVTEGINEFEKPEPTFVIGGPPGFRGFGASGFGPFGFGDSGFGESGFGGPFPGFNSGAGAGGASGLGGPGALPCFKRRINPF